MCCCVTLSIEDGSFGAEECFQFHYEVLLIVKSWNFWCGRMIYMWLCHRGGGAVDKYGLDTGGVHSPGKLV